MSIDYINTMFSSSSGEYETPQDLYDMLNKEFNFTLDPCATDSNAKCPHYFTKEQNGLTKTWYETVFMNPPYGRQIKKWVEKAYLESLKGSVVVCLLPSRTDTHWWHEWVMYAKEIRFIKGRLKFGDMKNAAPFPSAIVIFKYQGFNNSWPKISSLELRR